MLVTPPCAMTEGGSVFFLPGAPRKAEYLFSIENGACTYNPQKEQAYAELAKAVADTGVQLVGGVLRVVVTSAFETLVNIVGFFGDRVI